MDHVGDKDFLAARRWRTRTPRSDGSTACSVAERSRGRRSRRRGSLSRSDTEVESLAGWPTTVVGRVCLGMPHAVVAPRESARVVRPDPIVSSTVAAIRSTKSVQADSVELACWWCWRRCRRRAAGVRTLHDMFAVPFRQPRPHRRARPRHPTAGQPRPPAPARPAPEPETDRVKQRQVVDAFLAASAPGRLQALLQV